MSKQLVMKDTLVSAGRGQNTENFISGILILSLSHPHTKLLIKLFTQSPSEHSSAISDLMRQGLWTLRNAMRNHSSSIDILDPCSLPKRFNGRVFGLQTLHDLDPETEASADIISEYTIMELVLCNLARV